MGKENSKLSYDDVDSFQDQTKFSKEEIDVIRSKFFQSYPSGKITREDWRKHYRNIFKNDSSDNYADFTFDSFDTNLDGVLDFHEIITIEGVQTRGSMEEKLKSIFDLYDRDSNGYITREEMLELLTAFCKFMKNADPSLGDESLPQKYVETIYKDLDENADGQLSWQEFVLGLSQQPRLREIFIQTFCPPI